MGEKIPTIWTVSDVAAWLDWPALKVKRAAMRGQIPCRSLPDGDLVFVPEELAAWLTALPAPARPEEEVARG
jgi:hypothetical protein